MLLLLMYSVSVIPEYVTVIAYDYKYTKDSLTAQCVNRLSAIEDLAMLTTAVLNIWK